jgi:hypothetical protein
MVLLYQLAEELIDGETEGHRALTSRVSRPGSVSSFQILLKLENTGCSI